MPNITHHPPVISPSNFKGKIFTPYKPPWECLFVCARISVGIRMFIYISADYKICLCFCGWVAWSYILKSQILTDYRPPVISPSKETLTEYKYGAYIWGFTVCGSNMGEYMHWIHSMGRRSLETCIMHSVRCPHAFGDKWQSDVFFLNWTWLLNPIFFTGSLVIYSCKNLRGIFWKFYLFLKFITFKNNEKLQYPCSSATWLSSHIGTMLLSST